jgi:hypothetical protein
MRRALVPVLAGLLGRVCPMASFAQAATPPAQAASAAEARNVHNTTRTSVNRDVNVNRNVNVNRHVDVDVDVDRDYHPVARAAAVTTAAVATAAVVGSIVHSIPPSCVQVMVGGTAYQQCGSTWYQPQYAGSSVQYVVVAPPR